MLWQKIDDSNNYAALVRLLTTETAPEHRAARQLHGRGSEIPRSVGEPAAADIGLVTPVLSASVQDSYRVVDHLVHDVSGRADVANAADALADQ